MKIDKFKNVNEDMSLKKKEHPYEITSRGELKKVFKESTFGVTKYYYLTDGEYERLKKLSDNTKDMFDNLEDMKNQYIKILKAAIQKVKSDIV